MSAEPKSTEIRAAEQSIRFKISASLVGFLGAVGAAIVPVTTAIQGYWQNELKRQELAHQIIMDFLGRVLDTKLGQSEQIRVLEILVSLPDKDDPLKAWAQAALNEEHKEIIQKQNEASYWRQQIVDLSSNSHALGLECEASWREVVDAAGVNSSEFTSLEEKADAACKKKDAVNSSLKEANLQYSQVKAQDTAVRAVMTSGPITSEQTPENVLSKVQLAIVAKMFPGTPKKEIRANLPFVLDALREQGLTSKPLES